MRALMHQLDYHPARGVGRFTLVVCVGTSALSAQEPPSEAVVVPVATGEARVGAKRVPMRDVSLLAIPGPDNQVMAATVTAAIGTPFGRVPIRGNIRLNVECSGAFRGTISYSAVVRFFAKLKGVDLITHLDGQVVRTDAAVCVRLPTDTIRGTAVVERDLMRGSLRQRGDSAHFSGPAWMVGDSSYHSIVRVTRADQSLSIRVNMYERGGNRWQRDP